jgi:hypothetical protein
MTELNVPGHQREQQKVTIEQINIIAKQVDTDLKAELNEGYISQSEYNVAEDAINAFKRRLNAHLSLI